MNMIAYFLSFVNCSQAHIKLILFSALFIIYEMVDTIQNIFWIFKPLCLE